MDDPSLLLTMSSNEPITLIVTLGSTTAEVLVQTDILSNDTDTMQTYLHRLAAMGDETAKYLSDLLATWKASELTTYMIRDEAARHFQRQLTAAGEPYASSPMSHKNVGASWD